MIKRFFVDGLKAFLPFALTVAIFVWLCSAIETFFGGIIKAVIGPEHYFTGLGLLVGIVLVFFIGVVYNAWIVRWFHKLADRIMRKIPLVKTLYNAINDLLSFLDSKKSSQMGKVVSFQWQGLRMIGLMTRQDFSDLPQGIAEEGEVAVYIPLSYQIGGMTIMIPADQVKPIDMKVEAAMRFVVMAGMGNNNREGPLGKNKKH